MTTTDKPRAAWWRDDDCACWRYTAPDGYCFGGDLHEFVYSFHPADGWTYREARKDAKDRERAEPLERCDRVPCDWCERYAAAPAAQEGQE